MQIKTKIVSCHTADSKPVKQEVNGTVTIPPLVFPAMAVPSAQAAEPKSFGPDVVVTNGAAPIWRQSVVSRKTDFVNNQVLASTNVQTKRLR